jgi:hypothetical protein
MTEMAWILVLCFGAFAVAMALMIRFEWQRRNGPPDGM